MAYLNKQYNSDNRNHKPRSAAERYDFLKEQKRKRREEEREATRRAAIDHTLAIVATKGRAAVPQAAQMVHKELWETLVAQDILFPCEEQEDITPSEQIDMICSLNWGIEKIDPHSYHTPNPASVNCCAEQTEEENERDEFFSKALYKGEKVQVEIETTEEPENKPLKSRKEIQREISEEENAKARLGGIPIELKLTEREAAMIWGIVPTQEEVGECHQFLVETYPKAIIG